MSGRSVRARRFTSVAAILAGASVGTFAVTSTVISATTPPTTTVAATSAPTSAAPTPTTAAAPATTAPPTTFPGPAPRASQRVASPVDIEKIRATSLPFRVMGISVALAIVVLAIAGFLYGKVRSRIPAVKVPKLAGAGGPSGGASATTTLPPPAPIPLPPPAVEDALSDTVIFEPPPTHHAPLVIAEPAREPDDDAEPADVVEADSGATEAAPPDAEPGPERPEPTEAPDRD
jgi:hypothetical protein